MKAQRLPSKEERRKGKEYRFSTNDPGWRTYILSNTCRAVPAGALENGRYFIVRFKDVVDPDDLDIALSIENFRSNPLAGFGLTANLVGQVSGIPDGLYKPRGEHYLHKVFRDRRNGCR